MGSVYHLFWPVFCLQCYWDTTDMQHCESLKKGYSVMIRPGEFSNVKLGCQGEGCRWLYPKPWEGVISEWHFNPSYPWIVSFFYCEVHFPFVIKNWYPHSPYTGTHRASVHGKTAKGSEERRKAPSSLGVNNKDHLAGKVDAAPHSNEWVSWTRSGMTSTNLRKLVCCPAQPDKDKGWVCWDKANHNFSCHDLF